MVCALVINSFAVGKAAGGRLVKVLKFGNLNCRLNVPNYFLRHRL